MRRPRSGLDLLACVPLLWNVEFPVGRKGNLVVFASSLNHQQCPAQSMCSTRTEKELHMTLGVASYNCVLSLP